MCLPGGSGTLPRLACGEEVSQVMEAFSGAGRAEKNIVGRHEKCSLILHRFDLEDPVVGWSQNFIFG